MGVIRKGAGVAPKTAEGAIRAAQRPRCERLAKAGLIEITEVAK